MDCRAPASRSTTRMPRRVSSCARVPPPAPEPMMTTALESSWAIWVMALREYRAAVFQRHVRQPGQIVESAHQVSALGKGLAFIAEVAVGDRCRVASPERRALRELEKRRLL